jgi:predicted dithiol-disulfide oxidoreductase (DUF899 family)
VAAERRKLPLGGVIKDDYVFDSATARFGSLRCSKTARIRCWSTATCSARRLAAPCVSCTSILDSLDGEAPHVVQRVNLAVVAKSPIDRILEFTLARGMRNLRLLSSAGNTYNRDYHGESDTGSQLPMMNVFVGTKAPSITPTPPS